MVSSERTAPSWSLQLDAARSPEEVMRIARAYLAAMPPEDFASIPVDRRPPEHFAVPEDVVLYTFALVEHHWASNEDRAAMFRLAKFFSEATRRIAILMSAAFGDPPAND